MVFRGRFCEKTIEREERKKIVWEFYGVADVKGEKEFFFPFLFFYDQEHTRRQEHYHQQYRPFYSRYETSRL